MSSRSIALVGAVIFAALLRILPHPWNFSPIAAMALFAGAHFRTRRAAFAIPLGTLLLSDLILPKYPHMWFNYACFGLVVCIGFVLRGRRSTGLIAVGAVSSSVIFFLTSNFGVWWLENIYSHNWQGLVACYTAAIPFFQGTLLGDLTYTALLFGAFRLAERSFPSLEQAPSL